MGLLVANRQRDWWLVGVLALYGSFAAGMWAVAFWVSSDSVQAAMIGAASAFTAGCAAVAGGLFTSSRAGRLQKDRETVAARREVYPRYAAAMTDDFKAREVKAAMESRRSEPDLADFQIEMVNDDYTQSSAYARETCLMLLRARAAVNILAGPTVAEWLEANSADEATPEKAKEFLTLARMEIQGS